MPARAKSKATFTTSRSDTFAVKKSTPLPAVKKTAVKKTIAAPAAAKTRASAQQEELRAMLTDLGREINELSAGADRLLKRLA